MLLNINRFMLDIVPIEIFVNKKMLFNRDVFRSTCNILFRKTNIDIFYLFFGLREARHHMRVVF